MAGKFYSVEDFIMKNPKTTEEDEVKEDEVEEDEVKEDEVEEDEEETKT